MKKLIAGLLLVCSLGMVGCGEPNNILKGTIIKKEIAEDKGYLTIKTENNNEVVLKGYKDKVNIYQEGTKVFFCYDRSDGHITYLCLDEGEENEK